MISLRTRLAFSALVVIAACKKPGAPVFIPAREVEPAVVSVRVDSARKELTVLRGSEVLLTIPGVALGVRGAGEKQKSGDEITPKGAFTIGWMTRESKYKSFIGLSYPNKEYADRGLQTGVIDQKTHSSIINALNAGRRPPQNTALGGMIGIHGLGQANPKVHQLGVNWTDGCIAVDNDQIEQIEKLVQPGMTVVIE